MKQRFESHQHMIAAVARQIEAMRRSPLHTLTSADVRHGRAPGDSSAVPRNTPFESPAGYEVRGERHRGGQGVVYEAIQLSTKRPVAVKVLYETGEGHAASRRRFEREIEILTQLRHPNIVTVHDSGIAGQRFYYVMDLVDGRPLDRWIDAQTDRRIEQAVRDGSRAALRDEVRETLTLFQKICDAVNAAHLRGVIHRDLKPGNILIDESGEPRVLDFGLAKYTLDPSGDSAAAHTMTQPGQFVGSIPWASPEQTQGESDQIDTRTDVYSLGVLLYHALTGQFPYDVHRDVSTVLDNIRTAAPRPMNRARLAARPSGAAVGIDDEVETIVLKCLQKDRERRYQTAGDLGRDIERYLRREPIEAKRDSMAYVIRTQIRRYRVPVAIAAAFVLMLVAGMVTSLSLWQTARTERDRALAAEAAAEAGQRDTQAVTDLLAGLLASTNPLERRDVNTTTLDLIDAFEPQVSERLAGRPAAEGNIRDIIGRAYLAYGQFEKAERNLLRAIELQREALGAEHFATITTELTLAHVYRDESRYEEARRVFESALDRLEGAAADEAPIMIHAKSSLAEVLIRLGDYEPAGPMLEQALLAAREIDGGKNTFVPRILHNQAMLVIETRGAAAAEPLIRAAIAERLALSGPHHPDIAINQIDLADSLLAQGRSAEAEEELRSAVSILERAYDGVNPRIPPALDRLAAMHNSRGETAEAESLLRRSLEMRRRLDRRPQRETVSNISNLGRATLMLGRAEEAAVLFREAIEMMQIVAPDGDREIGIIYNNLGRALFELKQYVEAETAMREALAANRRLRGESDPVILNDLLGLLRIVQALGNKDDAIEVCRELIEARRRITPEDVAALQRDEERLEKMLTTSPP